MIAVGRIISGTRSLETRSPGQTKHEFLPSLSIKTTFLGGAKTKQCNAESRSVTLWYMLNSLPENRNLVIVKLSAIFWLPCSLMRGKWN
ncbi:MAG: hypothetical protein CL912_13100 [Deltaproteobacteria bacterium]|nr:hypothetical protein [Deltaproteobacteria bacterium]